MTNPSHSSRYSRLVAEQVPHLERSRSRARVAPSGWIDVDDELDVLDLVEVVALQHAVAARRRDGRPASRTAGSTIGSRPQFGSPRNGIDGLNRSSTNRPPSARWRFTHRSVARWSSGVSACWKERKGIVTSGNRSAEIEVAHVALDDLHAPPHVVRLAPERLRQHVEHAARDVDADRGDAGPRARQQHASGPAADLEHRPAGLAREVDVEADVGPRGVRQRRGRRTPRRCRIQGRTWCVSSNAARVRARCTGTAGGSRTSGGRHDDAQCARVHGAPPLDPSARRVGRRRAQRLAGRLEAQHPAATHDGPRVARHRAREQPARAQQVVPRRGGFDDHDVELARRR